MPRSFDHLVKDILNEIAFIKKVTRHHTLKSYTADALTWRAVERALLTISEAVRNLPDEQLRRQPDIPWSAIKGMGNFLRHEYHKIDDAVIWDTVRVNLPPLERAIKIMSKPGASKLTTKKRRDT